MCGIAGFYCKKQLYTSSHLEMMTNSMPHRGPDASGYYISPNQLYGLGHRRLSIIDLSSSANQPMTSHNGKYVMVFNGEIYNFKSIAQRLIKEFGYQFKTTSDTEVLLEAFVQFGKNFVEMLNGMFTIAILEIESNELTLYRDRLGVKPLYYFWDGQNFAFASELKAIIANTLIKPTLTINQSAIYYYLHLGYIPAPFSIYNEVNKMNKGTYFIINNEGLDEKKYWQPENIIESNTVASKFDDTKKQLNDLLLSATELRMISDVPFGTFLSGGIDSSLVTAMAQRNSSVPINTFSIAFKESKYNEAKYARSVAKHLGTNHHEFEVSEKEVLPLISKLPFAFDEPFADSSALPTMLVSQLAKKHVTMTLSGDGGDELFMGYGMYNWAARLNHPLLPLVKPLLVKGLQALGNKYQRGAMVFNYPNKANLKSHLFSQEQYLFSEFELKDLLVDNTDIKDINLNEFPNSKRKLSTKEQQSLFDLNFYLPDDLLVKVDRASMQFSLETRSPFLDYRVVAFALNMPEQFKVKGNIKKYILQEVLFDYVPRNLFNRPKWGFSIPLENWLRSDLKYLIDNYLSEEAITKGGLVNYKKVHQLKEAYFAGKHYLYNRLWALIQLQQWIIYINNNEHEPNNNI
jgi:asparagine synthase (glutamine-hydrolysing)